MELMTVQQLCEELYKLNPDAIVLLSNDAEGNRIKPICLPFESCNGSPDGNAFDLIHEDDEDEYADDDKFPVVCLYPV